MLGPLPETLDFFKQVERDKRFHGALSLGGLDRLVSGLASDKGEAEAEISFTTRAGVPCLAGKVRANVEMVCQRCLEPVQMQIEGSFRFGLVESEEEFDNLPAEFEPFIVTDGEQSLYDVLEDELILSLPLVSRHDYECSEVMKQQQPPSGDAETYRPFAGLKDLMNQD